MIYTREYVQQLLDLLEPLKGLEQDNQWHPERDVYTHSVQCYYIAMRETDNTDQILAALLHDVGKAVHKLGHDKESIVLLSDIVSVRTLWLVGNHMRINNYLDGSMVKAKKAIELAEHPWFNQLVMLNRWDKMGRKAGWNPTLTQDDLIHDLNTKANPRRPHGTMRNII